MPEKIKKKHVTKVIKAFEKICLPKSNESVDRHIFLGRVLDEGDLVIFSTTLKKLNATCEFGELRDNLIRDSINSGVRDKVLKDRLFTDSDSTLEKCMKIAKANALSELELKALQEEKIDILEKNKITKPHQNKFTSDKEMDSQNKVNPGFQNNGSRFCG